MHSSSKLLQELSQHSPTEYVCSHKQYCSLQGENHALSMNRLRRSMSPLSPSAQLLSLFSCSQNFHLLAHECFFFLAVSGQTQSPLITVTHPFGVWFSCRPQYCWCEQRYSACECCESPHQNNMHAWLFELCTQLLYIHAHGSHLRSEVFGRDMPSFRCP